MWERRTEMGIRSRRWSSRTTSCFRITRPENSVIAMTANAGKKPMARIVSHFVQFRQNGTIDACRTATVSTLVFLLLLTVVIPSFATVYTIDYAAQAAAVVVMMPMVVLVLIFQRGVVSGLTAGIIER